MDLPLYWIALIAFGIINFFLVSASVLVYAERKVSGYIQNRPGPNRVGPAGFLQPFADVVKLVFKENIVPRSASPFVHTLAPWLMVLIAMTVPAVIPFARGVVIADVDVGVLVVLALTSISVYGVTLAGWSSNSKYSLLGGLRSSAQMISYELSMGLAVVSVVLIAGSLNLTAIVEDQSGGWAILGWNVFRNPVGALLFIITAFAETNRAPFDLPEAEQELVGGYHTEYSGIKFGMFFLAEYVNLFLASFLIATLFFGGYLVPFEPLLLKAFPSLEGSVLLGLLQFGSLLLKAGFFAFVFIWVRWTLPRFKYNQLMTLGWKYLLPIALVNTIVVALGVALLR
ncbi:NADH-quinone oxidoreductase subunit NuoH [Rhodocaloribacter litoris]|uniref:NADH-quinone oxidoreductase subunit NuoH n=1 Tax=Rhodocaloribacter litoris TaxID=2558931 RepID=UPI0014224BD9|nr:NADH-quinone oxidoreductase subunit NuoH [Rhodocaloribacter litoris]QXD14599.1 NADH-quinone oxidoreductase subunit NuoH [Rhodocaloribacter litoris]GIV59630.1 MAG: NADH-quinone oxidoreductase subunit H [Rhodothermaceae bacterium]